jgi:hypothetical protein
MSNLSFQRIAKPPGNAYRNLTWIKEREDPNNFPLKFSLTKPSGFYFVDVGVIAFREVDGKMYAQVEHFFPNEKPVEIVQNEETFIQLTVKWPDIPLGELGSYGIVYPSRK